MAKVPKPTLMGTSMWVIGVDGQMIGHGVFTWPSGDRHEGQSNGDKMNGKGTYTFPDGRKYVGDWVDGYFLPSGKVQVPLPFILSPFH